jgi:hypothetical protein
MNQPARTNPIFDQVLAGSTTQEHKRSSQKEISAGARKLHGQFIHPL